VTCSTTHLSYFGLLRVEIPFQPDYKVLNNISFWFSVALVILLGVAMASGYFRWSNKEGTQV
jgi:hypothetical protein